MMKKKPVYGQEGFALFKTVELPIRRGNVPLRVAKGHFATNHSHINYYIDVTRQKVLLSEAKAMAEELAKGYAGTRIDAILCLDGMSLIGACLAQTLAGQDNPLCDPTQICLIEPEYDSHGQMIFRDNYQPFIRGKNVLILMASITTGYTANRGVQTTAYYGGRVVGIAGLYRAVDQLEEGSYSVNSIYSLSDLPDYESYSYADCPYCRAGRRIEALVNSYGYSKF